MKKYILPAFASLLILSCNQTNEKNETSSVTSEKQQTLEVLVAETFVENELIADTVLITVYY